MKGRHGLDRREPVERFEPLFASVTRQTAPAERLGHGEPAEASEQPPEASGTLHDVASPAPASKRLDHLAEQRPTSGELDDWCADLRHWAERRLAEGTANLLDEAVPAFETVMINAAMAQTRGRKQDAAKLLGWGRNTLTRKIKELDLG